MKEGIKIFLAVVIIIIVIALAGSVFALRFVIGGDEDAWICNTETSQWERHGNPNALMPEIACGEQENLNDVPVGTMEDCAKSDNFSRKKCQVLMNLREKYEVNINENISNLSTEPEVLGGSFYVTDILWKDENNAVVSYEDGHNSFTAGINMGLDPMENKKIVVNDFRMLTKNGEDIARPDDQNISFHKQGNIVKNNPGLKKDVWYLIAEEPGSSAINYELVFNDKSRCEVNEKLVTCDFNSFKQGEKKSVIGRLDNGKIIVVDIGSVKSINNYQDCVYYGYPILKTIPEQCKTPDGKTFINTNR